METCNIHFHNFPIREGKLYNAIFFATSAWGVQNFSIYPHIVFIYYSGPYVEINPQNGVGKKNFLQLMLVTTMAVWEDSR